MNERAAVLGIKTFDLVSIEGDPPRCGCRERRPRCQPQAKKNARERERKRRARGDGRALQGAGAKRQRRVLIRTSVLNPLTRAGALKTRPPSRDDDRWSDPRAGANGVTAGPDAFYGRRPAFVLVTIGVTKENSDETPWGAVKKSSDVP